MKVVTSLGCWVFVSVLCSGEGSLGVAVGL